MNIQKQTTTKSYCVKASCFASEKTEEIAILQFLAIHCTMSFLIKPSEPPLEQFNIATLGSLVYKCLYWVINPEDLVGCIIFAAAVSDFGHMIFDEVKRCLLESLFLGIWVVPEFLAWDESVNCFVMFVFVLPPGWSRPGGGRISAAGFILSSHRSIQLPTLLPISKSLCCMFL